MATDLVSGRKQALRVDYVQQPRRGVMGWHNMGISQMICRQGCSVKVLFYGACRCVALRAIERFVLQENRIYEHSSFVNG